MSDLNGSVDMFDDSYVPEASDWRGTPLEQLRPKFHCTYPAIRSTSNHTVLFKLPIPQSGHLEPHPTRPADKWGADHVRMPHSPENLFPVSQNEVTSRWKIIVNSFKTPITSSEELERAILTYHSQSQGELTFDALHEFFNNTLKEEETSYFFRCLMPNIIELAMEIEDKFRGGLPILRRGHNRSISLSQVQAGVLLANAFLCTFPRRNSTSQQSHLPYINFNKLFQCGGLSSVQEKLKCFTNYFRRIIKKRPTGAVTYTRRHVRPSELPRWADCDEKLSRIHISSSGTIEENGGGMMEIDFANKFVGGGVLGRGSVQEEIRFLICPELVVARLFSESLDDTEALIVTGCERFNSYEGYGQTFTWSSNYDDSHRAKDTYRRMNTIVVAIDAVYNIWPADQFKCEVVSREINKAYAGFSFGQDGAIATGNWGCGAFKGDPLLKFLLQLMAASACGKPVAYFTFGDDELRDKLFKMYQFLAGKNITVGTLWKTVYEYSSLETENKSGDSLYDYIYCSLNSVTEPVRQADTVAGKYKRKYECGELEAAQSWQDMKKTNEADSANKDGVQPKQQLISCPKAQRDVSKTPDPVKLKCSSLDVDGLTIAPKLMSLSRNGLISKKTSLIGETSTSIDLNDSTNDTFPSDVSGIRSGKIEPVSAETCSLQTEEGRRKCIEVDQERWEAYQSAMTKFGNDSKIDDTSPNSSSSSIRIKTGPTKRKISDYFPSSSPQ